MHINLFIVDSHFTDFFCYGGVCSTIVTVNQVQIMDEAVYISHSSNTLGKGTNPIFSLKLWVNNRVDKAL